MLMSLAASTWTLRKDRRQWLPDALLSLDQSTMSAKITTIYPDQRQLSGVLLLQQAPTASPNLFMSKLPRQFVLRLLCPARVGLMRKPSTEAQLHRRATQPLDVWSPGL